VTPRSELTGLSRWAVSASNRARLTAVAVIAVVVAAIGVFVQSSSPGTRHISAYFAEAPSLYVGDQVQILGVPVGQVTSITPESGDVRVGMSYSAAHRVPADAKAVIMAPTLVSSRFVQLTPAYTRGTTLAQGATIPMSRTAEPVQWDQILRQLDDLATALGPQGANQNGALSRLIDTASNNLQGQGGDLNATIRELSAAISTLADNRGDLFSTLNNLQVFTSALANSDAQVSSFNQQLASVSQVLADNRTNLAQALQALNGSLGVITDFISTNRSQLTTDLGSLGSVANNLAYNRQALADLLQVAPPALSNFHNIYDPLAGGLTGVFATTNLRDPAETVCAALAAGSAPSGECKVALTPLDQVLSANDIPITASPYERNGRSNQATPQQEPKR
jgi:phospholipid/cholesterol/gamma-HCH transport system substrate-binding protein